MVIRPDRDRKLKQHPKNQTNRSSKARTDGEGGEVILSLCDADLWQPLELYLILPMESAGMMIKAFAKDSPR